MNISRVFSPQQELKQVRRKMARDEWDQSLRLRALFENNFEKFRAHYQQIIKADQAAWRAHKSEWDRSSSLRAEFRGDFDAYLSWKEAKHSGRVSIKTGATVKSHTN